MNLIYQSCNKTTFCYQQNTVEEIKITHNNNVVHIQSISNNTIVFKSMMYKNLQNTVYTDLLCASCFSIGGLSVNESEKGEEMGQN